MSLLQGLIEGQNKHRRRDNLGYRLWTVLKQSPGCNNALNRFFGCAFQLISAQRTRKDTISALTFSQHGVDSSREVFQEKNIYDRHQPLLCGVMDTLGHLSTDDNVCNSLMELVSHETNAEVIDAIFDLLHIDDKVVDGLSVLEAGERAEEILTLPLTGAEDIESMDLSCATQLSAALFLTSLCRLKYDDNTCNNEALKVAFTQLQRNTRRQINQFMSNPSNVVICNPGTTERELVGGTVVFALTQGFSRDLTRRALRLQANISSLAIADELSTTTSIFMRCNRTEMELQHLHVLVSSSKQETLQLRAELEKTRANNNRLHQTVKATQAVHQGEVTRVRTNAQAEAMELVELHVEEKSQAEWKSRQYQERMEMAEKRQSQLEKNAEIARKNAEKMRSELNRLDNNMKYMEKLALSEKENKARVEEELKIVRVDLSKKQENFEQVVAQSEHHQRSLQSDLANMERTAKEFKGKLEGAFSKLILLAEVYRSKEDEVKRLNEEHQDAIRAVERKASHQQKAAEKTSTELQQKNRELKRELAKAAKKLEDERERAQRRNPVSYINRLHDESMRSDATSTKNSHRSQRSGKENSFSVRRR